ncbi:MAG: 2-amino-4-hydroxy-6-hydroxymethyldihydropteridine diphosphokinase [bacterium]|nr:2-amino-4-hydroxy-6-hydroxymethyldihydropteridine diphosphokinase [bacterium]
MDEASYKPKNPERAVIAMGSNIEDRWSYLQKGLDLWRNSGGVNVLAVSSIIETKPVAEHGEIFDLDFLNLCFVCDVTLSPLELMDLCHKIEKKCGRDRDREKKSGNRDRTLDCDIIFYGDREIVHTSPELIIPHPRWKGRDFVVKPMMELREYLTEWQAGRI